MGVVDAFRVEVRDASNAISGQTGLIQVNINTGSDQSPTYISGCKTGATATTTVSCGSGNTAQFSPTSGTMSRWAVTKNGGSYTWTYARLAALAGIRDTDTSVVSFVVTQKSSNLTAVTGASLMKNGANVTVYPGTGTPATTAMIAPGESITFTSSNNINSTYDNHASETVFQIKAYDGNTQATAAAIGIMVSLQASATNAVEVNPTFTYSAPIPIPVVTSGVTFEISYSTIRLYTDMQDYNNPSETSGLLLITGSPGANFTVTKKLSGGSCGTAITVGTTTLALGDSLCVTPDATSAGTTGAGLNANSTNVLPVVNVQLRNTSAAGSDNATSPAPTLSLPILVRGP
jgi:hypothetical protein